MASEHPQNPRGGYRQQCPSCERLTSAAAYFCPWCGESLREKPPSEPTATPTHHLYLGKRWGELAEENVEEWGLQPLWTLLLATQEELGELTQAYLEATAEDGEREQIKEELDDLAALCFQLYWRYET